MYHRSRSMLVHYRSRQTVLRSSRPLSLPCCLLAAVIVLLFIFVLTAPNGGLSPATGVFSAAGNDIARVAISGAAVVALVALVIVGLKPR